MAIENLKHDLLGTTRLVHTGDTSYIERDTHTAHAFVRWLARRLAAREATALAALAGIEHVPRLLEFDGAIVRRSYVPGLPLHAARPQSRAYFGHALRVLRSLHRAGVAHNDLAKEANWLVVRDDTCAIVDFQLALCASKRTARFRRRAYEDLRHLVKHKRTYRPLELTARERRVLATPTLATRSWRMLVKPVYRFVTRALLRWPERSGPAERVSSGRGAGTASARMAGKSPAPYRMDICHAHNLNKPLDAPKPYGIRVSIKATDTFARLLGAGWQRHHWFATREERDAALADMASEHLYSRHGDKPTLVLEAVEQPA